MALAIAEAGADVVIDPGPGDEDTWQHFCREFSKCGVVTEAAEAAHVSTTTVYRWRDGSERCLRDWSAAKAAAADVLRTEARRRAIQGVREPVFFQGEVCGHIQRYSDSLMARLLVAHCTEHKDESTIKLTGVGGDAVKVELQPPAGVAKILADLLAPDDEPEPE